MEAVKPVGNRKVSQTHKALSEFLKANADKKFYVFSHDSPDPDSLSSGAAMIRILSFYGIECDAIYYCKAISHTQNKVLQNLLKLPAKRWNKDLEKELENNLDNCIIIFVDVAGTEQKNMSIPFQPNIVIDHHKTVPKADIVIHDEIGACATLMLDLMLNVPPKEDNGDKTYCFDHEAEGMVDICTALAVGIKTDTLGFIHETTTEYDFKAHQILTRYMSKDRFLRIDNYELPPYVYEYSMVAWKNRNVMGTKLIAGIEYIDESKSDCIPFVADWFMRLEGVQTVVIYGIVEGETGGRVRAAVRTTSAAFDCDELSKNIFGEKNAGAKHGVGGAQVDLEIDFDLLDKEDRINLWNIEKSQIEKKFIKVTGE